VLIVDEVAMVIVTPPLRAVTLEFDTPSEPADVEPLSTVPITLPGLSDLIGNANVVVPMPLDPSRMGAADGVTGFDIPGGDVAVGDVEVATTLKV
jgi:hypothetical protein